MSAAVEFSANELNEAIYFTFKDYSSFLTFTMVELATYYFVIEAVLSEQLGSKF